MSPSACDKRCVELEQRALVLESCVDAQTSSHGRLQTTVAAAELYMKALSIASDPSNRKWLDARTSLLITYAEKLKAVGDVDNASIPSLAADLAAARAARPVPTSTRKHSTREQIIILEGSKLSGSIFRPWMEDPSENDFSLNTDSMLFEDDSPFSLSDMMRRHFAGWERPAQALSHIRIETNDGIAANEPSMENPPALPYDLVQDVTPNCSVVASLCVGTARASHGHRKLLASVIHPYDQLRGHPGLSKNGKYIMKLYFNGTARAVEIDDRLPASQTDRILHIIDRSHPGLLWPALIEKAYLKIRGGYDFPGSNSGTDLHVILGWIPQQIALHHEEVHSEDLWMDVFRAWTEGDVLVTLGTGKISRKEMKYQGLAAEHDYAVLELRDNDRGGEMLIKNPWRDGEVWKGAARRRPNPGHDADQNSAATEDMIPGTFWMDWQLVFQYFAHMYINWNPALFQARQDIHFSWQLESTSRAGHSVFDHPQFNVQADADGEVWLLLNRHFRTGDFTSENHGKNGYISLHLFNNNGTRVCTTEGVTVRGPFVDSPNTLLRFQAKGKQQYTVVAMSQSLTAGKHNFTLSVFAQSAIMLDEAMDRYLGVPQVLRSAWTYDTAGGSSDNLTYLENPQFSLSIPRSTDIALFLKVIPKPVGITISTPDSTASHVVGNGDIDDKYHVKLLIAPSSSTEPLLNRLLSRDPAVHSGEYRRQQCVIESHLDAGHYTVIASTFDPGVRTPFELSLYTATTTAQQSIQVPILKAIPSLRASRFSTLSHPAIFDASSANTKLMAQLHLPRSTKAFFIARVAPAALSTGSSSDIKPQPQLQSRYSMSIQRGTGAYSSILGNSGPFTELNRGWGVKTNDVVLNAATSANPGVWVVLESDGAGGSGSTGSRETVQIEVLSEDEVAFGGWRRIDA